MCYFYIRINFCYDIIQWANKKPVTPGLNLDEKITGVFIKNE